MVKLFAFVVLVALLLFGCAVEHYRPTVDSAESRGNYGADIVDCRQLAGRQSVTGAATGTHGNDIAPAAPRDAADGESDRMTPGEADQQAAIARCMAGRGYNVVAQ